MTALDARRPRASQQPRITCVVEVGTFAEADRQLDLQAKAVRQVVRWLTQREAQKRQPQ